MIRSIRGLILHNGNVVRHDIAYPETIARYLGKVRNLAEYRVSYYLKGATYNKITAEHFLALYHAGRIPRPPRITQDW